MVGFISLYCKVNGEGVTLSFTPSLLNATIEASIYSFLQCVLMNISTHTNDMDSYTFSELGFHV